jgi:S1-C subfamily serine protease
VPAPAATAEPPPTNAQPSDKADQKFGTGILVTKDAILTNEHVARGCTRPQVNRVGEPAVTARVVTTDPTNDLALLQANIKGHTDLVPKPSFRRAARVGETVFAFGFPLTGLLATSGNFTNGIITASAGLGDDIRSLQISAPIQPGNSGGPLLDQSGNVLGIVAAKLDALRVSNITNDLAQNVNFAIKASIAIDFLEAHNVTVETVTNTQTLAPADIAERAGAFTVYIQSNSDDSKR